MRSVILCNKRICMYVCMYVWQTVILDCVWRIQGLKCGGCGDGQRQQYTITVDVEASKRRARSIDKVSRKSFPTAFLLFNVVYWIAYTLPTGGGGADTWDDVASTGGNSGRPPSSSLLHIHTVVPGRVPALMKMQARKSTVKKCHGKWITECELSKISGVRGEGGGEGRGRTSVYPPHTRNIVRVRFLKCHVKNVKT